MTKQKFKKCYTKKDIENDPRVDNIRVEYDDCTGEKSWWCWMKPGWEAYNNSQHVIHERTIKGICDVLEDVQQWPDDPELQIQ